MSVFLTVCASFIGLALLGLWLDKRPVNPNYKPKWWKP